MISIFKREFIYLWYYFTLQLQQILFYWILGMVLGSIISVFEKDRIHRLFASMKDKPMGILGVIPASALGILPPYVCMEPYRWPRHFQKTAWRTTGWRHL